MINIPFRALASILILPLFLLAPSETRGDFSASVFLISAPGGECATAFAISHNELVTNGHVARTLCPHQQCSQIKLSRSLSIGATPLPFSEGAILKIKAHLASRDLTILSYEGKEPIIPLPVAAALPQKGAPLSIVGYPGCNWLEKSAGAVEGYDPLELHTSASGTFGNSGSPIVSDRNEVIGVVTGSASLSHGVEGLLFGGRFPLKGSLIDDLLSLVALDSGARVVKEAERLNEWYEKSVLSVQGWRRIEKTLDFLLRVEELGAANMGLKGIVPLPRTSLYLDSFGPEADWNPHLTTLNLYSAFAEHGVFNERFAPIVFSTISVDPPLTHAFKVIEQHYREMPLGVTLHIILYSCIGALLLSVFAAVWGLSMGIVYDKFTGGFWKRMGKLTLFGLLWPFSFIVFSPFLRRKR